MTTQRNDDRGITSPPAIPFARDQWSGSQLKTIIPEYIGGVVFGSERGHCGYDNREDHLIAYLKPIQEDYDRCPDLVGVEEVWVVIDLMDERFDGDV